MLEGKLPEFSVFVGVHGGMVSRMFVSSVVSKPYIIPFVGQHKPWGLIFIINEECVAGVKQSMLQNDGLETRSDYCVFFLNSEHPKYVSIFGFYKVLLDRVFIVLAIVNEGVFGFGMGGSD
jgi:hypothetical protein